jgi:DNA-binding response OmpR family regulator
MKRGHSMPVQPSCRKGKNGADKRSCFHNHPLACILAGMPRPTILVAEPEPSEALSVRKLVLETAKYNVLTAHTTREALDIFHLFPNINAIVLVMGGIIDCRLVAQSIKNVTAKITILALSPRIGDKCESVDHTLSSHEPEELVKLLRSLLGDPRQCE